MRRCSILVTFALATAVVGQSPRYFVRVHDDVVVPAAGPGVGVASAPIAGAANRTAPAAGAGPTASPVGVCAVVVDAFAGQPLSSGTLRPLAWGNPACIDRNGRIAFVANVAGSTRNQGVFVADAAGIHPIAIGCGQGGGSGVHGTCGDPAPGGGTFAGFFGGTAFAPPINLDGDVLFLADIAGGAVSRGLFLYRGLTQTIVKVAAVGDPSPLGGTFDGIGPGSLNNRGQVAFLARGAGTTNSNLFLWQAGVVTKIAAVGDPAPLGGSYFLLGTESLGFVDGTQVPMGPVPSINDCGQIAWRAFVSGGPVSIGIVVRNAGVDAWHLRAGDPTPVGGTYSSFQGPILNGHGDIAVFADFQAGLNSGWFRGHPGAFTKALMFGDPVDGGSCAGLAVSRSPMTPFDDDGNLLLWCALGTNQGRYVLVDRTGGMQVVVRQGDVTPLGGTYGTLDAWPSMSSTGRLLASTGIAGGGATDAHFTVMTCQPTLTIDPCTPIGSQVRVDNQGPAGGFFYVGYSQFSTSVPAPPFGELRIGPSPIDVLAGPLNYPGNNALHTFTAAVPNAPYLVGMTFYLQALAFSSPIDVLTNQASVHIR